MLGTIAPPRALWRASAGRDVACDGLMRGGVLVRRLGTTCTVGRLRHPIRTRAHRSMLVGAEKRTCCVISKYVRACYNSAEATACTVRCI
jgi:hypothetical protein